MNEDSPATLNVVLISGPLLDLQIILREAQSGVGVNVMIELQIVKFETRSITSSTVDALTEPASSQLTESDLENPSPTERF